MHRYKTYYNNIISYDLLFKDHFINVMQLPQCSNITLNIGLGQNALLDKKQIITSLTALELISSQKAYQTRSKKSIDKFKLRQNMLIGSKVTLRNNNMYNFLENFTHFILPSLDSFSDLTSKYVIKKSSKKAIKNFSFYSLSPFFQSKTFFNKYYAFNFGIDDFFCFNTIPYDKFGSISKNFGFNITIKFKFLKSKKSNHLLYPSYILSSLQLPVGSSS